MRLPSGEGVSLGDDENVLEPGSGDGYTPQWKYYMPLNWKLQSGYIYVNVTSITFLRKYKKPEEKQEDKKKSKLDLRTPTRKTMHLNDWKLWSKFGTIYSMSGIHLLTKMKQIQGLVSKGQG